MVASDEQQRFHVGKMIIFLKRAKKLLPYIDIGEANKVMARAMENIKKRKQTRGQTAPTPRT
jgi:DNA transposition AAA+ family ATPase